MIIMTKKYIKTENAMVKSENLFFDGNFIQPVVFIFKVVFIFGVVFNFLGRLRCWGVLYFWSDLHFGVVLIFYGTA